MALPQKTADDGAGAKAAEQRLQGHVKLLITMLANASDLKLNNDQLAEVMGFKTGKNIPRKINEVVRPFGFQYMGGRVVPANATDSADSADPITGTADTGLSPAASKPPKPKTSRKKAPKKRKLEEDEDEDQDKVDDKDEEAGEIREESG